MLEKIVKIKGRNTFEKKVIRLAIFVWNLIIYSIPLNLFEHRIIPIPQPILNFLASIEGSLLSYVGISVAISHNVISACGVSFEIIDRCSGYKSFFGLFAIIMATPTKSIKNRLKWFLYLAPFALLTNIIRIFSTIFLHCVYKMDIYFIHNILWQILTTSTVIILWIIFLVKNKQELIEF